LSFKQFGFIFAPVLLSLLVFRIFGLGIVFFVLAIPIMLSGIAIAFGVFNGKHIYEMAPMLISYIRTPKVMIFRKANVEESFATVQNINPAEAAGKSTVLEAPQSRLKQLALMLDQKNQEEYDILNKK
jgi:hypothetical protein